MTVEVADLIAILQRHNPRAVVVLSMFPGESSGPMDVVAVERIDVCPVQLTAVEGSDEYRKRYAVGVDGDVAGVWLG